MTLRRHPLNSWSHGPRLDLPASSGGPGVPAAGPAAHGASRPPLQPPHRGGLLPLGAAVRPLPRPAPPGRDGRARDQRLPHAPRRGTSTSAPRPRRRPSPRCSSSTATSSAARSASSATWSAPASPGACRWCSRASEVKALLAELDGDRWLMASLHVRLGAAPHGVPAPARPRPRAVARARSWCATARAARTASRCCRARSSPPSRRSSPARARSTSATSTTAGARSPLPGALARKYPNAPARLALAVGLPAAAPLAGPRDRRGGPPPRPRDDRPARRQGGRLQRRHRQARHLPHAAPLVRDPPARGRLRHPHHPGAPRPQGRAHDDDLRARPQPRRPGRAQPDGRPVTPATPYTDCPWRPSQPPAIVLGRRGSCEWLLTLSV